MLAIIVSGASSLATYLAGHVLLCLLPALFIAGGISALVPASIVTRSLGAKASPFLSYPVAAVGGFVLAVCSCTILPLFSSIYRRGAGLGPAITFLFVGPAINILAVSLTSVQLGVDFAVARLVLSILFGIGIGVIMARVFQETSKTDAPGPSDPFAGSEKVQATGIAVVLLSLLVLVVGTLPLAPFKVTVGRLTLPTFLLSLEEQLARWVPANPSLGVEGLGVHGVALIVLLAALGAVLWRTLRDIEPTPRAVASAAGVAVVVLLAASLRFVVDAGNLQLEITGRSVALIAAVALLVAVARRLDAYDLGTWFQESWRFAKQIMPLLLIGVFLAGAARQIIPASFIRSAAGENTIWANLLATLFGAVLYFPTLVEVPVAHTLLSLGMHKGPLLAYLMADPELSAQSILVTSKVLGRKKVAVYVGLVIIAATLAGFVFGTYVEARV